MVLVCLPVPLTPRPSTKTATMGPSAGSVTTVAMTTTEPENVTVSGSPVFTDEALPETGTVKLETVLAWACAGSGARRPPRRSENAIGSRDGMGFVMVLAPGRLERGGKDV